MIQNIVKKFKLTINKIKIIRIKQINDNNNKSKIFLVHRKRVNLSLKLQINEEPFFVINIMEADEIRNLTRSR